MPRVAGRRRLAGAVACLVLVGACSGAPEPGPSAARPPLPTSSPELAERHATRAPGPLVENSAFGRSRRLIGRAVRDLERLGFWRRLTGHLYRIYLSSRDGLVNVPDDGHLADALLTAAIDEQGSGGLCDIRFYPAAIARDLRRQRGFHTRGLLAEPPATPRQFWVSILGHELAHCLPQRGSRDRRGEAAARRWEERVLDAARVSLPPS